MSRGEAEHKRSPVTGTIAEIGKETRPSGAEMPPTLPTTTKKQKPIRVSSPKQAYEVSDSKYSMKAKELLKEIRKDMRDAAKKFITAKPPHPSEILKRKEKQAFPCEGASDYDSITLERERIAEGNLVHQTTEAVGITFESPEAELKTALGFWSRDEFQKELEPEPGLEMA